MERVDREEFLKRLSGIFCPITFYSERQLLKALIMGDTAVLDAFRAKAALCDSEKQKYMDAWDAAKDDAAKDAVVGGVTLENIV